MLTNFIRARDDARASQPRLLKRHPTAKPCQAPARAVDSLLLVAKSTTPNLEFSPLIREFLDECGYSDQ